MTRVTLQTEIRTLRQALTEEAELLLRVNTFEDPVMFQSEGILPSSAKTLQDLALSVSCSNPAISNVYHVGRTGTT